MSVDTKQQNLGNPMRNFANNLESLREFLNVVRPFLERETREYQKARYRELIPLAIAVSESGKTDIVISDEQQAKLRQAFGTEFDVVKNEDGSVRLEMEGEASEKFSEAFKGLSLKNSHETLLYRNCLISLVSSAEWFLSQVLRRFFHAFPDAAGVKDKTLTLEDLRKLGSIEEAQAYLITLRVDEIMWGGFDDWIRFLRNTVKLSMGYMEADEKALVEVFQRRNVMIHNNGVVNPSYLAKVDEKLRNETVLGDELGVQDAYLQTAIDLVEKNFLLIAAELWKKLAPKDQSRAAVLNDQTMQALLVERYSLASGLSRFSTEDKQTSDKWLTYAKLNYWQTEKWAGRFDSVRKEIEEADFSGKDDLSQMARHVLLAEYDEAFGLLKTVMLASKLSLKSLEEWPIFKEFRKEANVSELIQNEKAKLKKTVQLTAEEAKPNTDDRASATDAGRKEPIN